MGEILLNRMYVGEYLENQNNIGHEIINLFKSDNGNNYIYVNPYGTMSKAHNNKIETILLVKYCGNCTMEILAKATDLEQIAFVDRTLTDDEMIKIHKKQVQYIDENNILYGGVKPYIIYQNNLRNEHSTYITFKANTLLKPLKPLFISAKGCKNYEIEKENYYHLGNEYIFSNQSLRMYLDENKHSNAYAILKDLIENSSLWENQNSTSSVLCNTFNETDDNILKIIHKENDENVFSDLFKYFFDYNKQGFYKFLKDIFNIDCFEETFTIKRELSCDIDGDRIPDGRIDLLIETKNNVIVIENKIKSGINGCSERHDVQSEKVQSQLRCYYIYTQNKEEYKDKKKHYFITAPDYNNVDLINHECSEHYKTINYSQIYNWFKDNKVLYECNMYFNDFLNALKKHTQAIDNSHEEEMHRRFKAVIEQAKSQVSNL